MSTVQNNQRTGNPGIVPPWLQQPVTPAPTTPRNPGIVPPWLQQPAPKSPAATTPTDFVPAPATVSPPNLVQAIAQTLA